MSAKTDALIAIDAALRPTGFARRGHTWLQPHPAGAWGWLGFGLTGTPAAFDLTPLVGVCFTRFDAVARTLGVPPAPLLSLPLGYLMPDKPCWRWTFRGGADSEPVAASLVGAFRKHGQPFVDRLAKWDAVVREIVGSEPLLGFDRPRKLAIIHAVNGDLGKAAGVLKTERERIAARQDVYARGYRAFAEHFERMF